MAIMCKCDRCQKTFKPTKAGNAVAKIKLGFGQIGEKNSMYHDLDHPVAKETYELCDDCFGELKNFLTKYIREEKRE